MGLTVAYIFPIKKWSRKLCNESTPPERLIRDAKPLCHLIWVQLWKPWPDDLPWTMVIPSHTMVYLSEMAAFHRYTRQIQRVRHENN